MTTGTLRRRHGLETNYLNAMPLAFSFLLPVFEGLADGQVQPQNDSSGAHLSDDQLL
jgi:hypothetical protein